MKYLLLTFLIIKLVSPALSYGQDIDVVRQKIVLAQLVTKEITNFTMVNLSTDVYVTDFLVCNSGTNPDTFDMVLDTDRSGFSKLNALLWNVPVPADCTLGFTVGFPVKTNSNDIRARLGVRPVRSDSSLVFILFGLQ